MELTHLHKLIARGEGESVEFKKKANHPEKIIREAVAFANSSGGHLFIGVADDCTIAGLNYPEEDEFILTKALNELCRPHLNFSSEIVRCENGARIVHFEIEEGDRKPHYAFLKKNHRYGKAFVRVNDKSVQASYEMRKILKERDSFDQPISIGDDVSALFKFFEKKSSITLTQYQELAGLNKKLASSKLVSLALSGALKILPQEGEDLFFPAR